MPGGLRGQKRVLDPLKLELWMSVNCQVDAAVKHMSSERAVSGLDH